MTGPGVSRALGGALVLVWLACAAPPSPTPEAPRALAPAAIAVHIEGGFQSEQPGAPRKPVRVHVLLDVTPSMRTPLDEQLTRLDAAKASLERFTLSLPSDQELVFHSLGAQRAEGCVALVSLDSSHEVSRETALWALRRAPARSEGSLAGALAELGRQIGDEGKAGARIVLFTDLGGECGGDLCSAVAGLVSQGIAVDLVRFGDLPAPACLLDPALATAPMLPGLPGRRPVGFRVELVSDDAVRRVIRGSSQGDAVEVPAGAVLVVTELDPPLTIGPLELSSGVLTHIRIVDFPRLSPPIQKWWVEHEDLSSGAVPSGPTP